ncbi:MAG: ParA family protein [Chloroflexota bacterium]
MRTLAVLNFKGGTGKTTTAVNLATGLALRNHRTLLVDADPQAGLTVSLGISQGQSLKYIILDDEDWRNCIIPARKSLDFVPADDALLSAERYLVRDFPDEINVFDYYCALLVGYEYMIFDCGPAFSALNENIINFVQEIIIPVSMDYLAVAGLLQLLKNLEKIRLHSDPHITIVPTFYDNTQDKSRETLQLLKYQFKDKVARPIRQQAQLSEAAGEHCSIYSYAPMSKGAIDYAHLVERVAQNVPELVDTRV